jgi:hypothetical protein
MTDWAGGWTPKGGGSVRIVLVGDGPGLGMAALAALLTVAAPAYTWRCFDEPPRRHAGSFPALMPLFQGGMCGFRHLNVTVPRDAVAHIHQDLAEAAVRMTERTMGAHRDRERGPPPRPGRPLTDSRARSRPARCHPAS